MNQRSITTATSFAVAAAMAISACGSDDGGLQAGDVDLVDETADVSVSEATDVADAESTDAESSEADSTPDSSGDSTSESSGDSSGAELTGDAPDYCDALAQLVAFDVDNTSDILDLYIEIFDGLAVEGPVDLRSQIAEFADEVREFQELDIDPFGGDEMSADEVDALNAFTQASEEFDMYADDLLPSMREDCGTDLVDGFEDPVAAVPTDDATDDDGEDDPDPVFEPFTEVVEGPFGSGEVSNATIQITDAVWSNRTPRDFEDESAEPDVEDTDERFLYLTVDIINDDPNDTFLADAESFAIIGEDGLAVVAEATGFVAPLIAPLTAQTRTLGFDLGEVVDAGTLSVRFADDAIPEIIDVIAPAEETPSVYPLDVPTPAPGEYIGSNTAACGVPWTWVVDTATVLLDAPAEFDGSGSSTNSRANTGQRWIRLTGSMTAGAQVDRPDALCSGNLNKSDFRLVVDGLGMEPLVSPNVVLAVNESFSLDLLWAIPADATDLAIRGLGEDGSMFESPFTLPELPAVRGE